MPAHDAKMKQCSNCKRPYFPGHKCLLLESLWHDQPDISSPYKFVKEEVDKDKSTRVYICSSTKTLSNNDAVIQLLSECENDMVNNIDAFIQKGSGWRLEKITHSEVRVGKYIPRTGGCYTHNLPAWLINKKAIINIKTRSHCFMHAVLAILKPTKNQQYARKNLTSEFSFKGLGNNVSLNEIPRFEKVNNVSVNVYTIDRKNIVPLKVCKVVSHQHVNLLLHDNHYFAIKNFNRLIGSASSWASHFCYNCLQGFESKARVARHHKKCLTFPVQRVYLPRTTTLKFDAFQKMLKSPFIIYADFETLVHPDSTYKDSDVNVRLLTAKHDSTYIMNHHEPCSYGMVIVDSEGKIFHDVFYRGTNANEKFLSSLLEAQELVKEARAKHNKPLIMTVSDEIRFLSENNCHICGEFVKDNEKVRDHDHITGKFRGPAHNRCNVNYRLTDKIPVVFHNLKSFDGHLIIQGISSKVFHRCEVIPHSSEKYLAIFLDDFIFIDSYAFLSSSLDTLAKMVPDQEKINVLKYFFPEDKLHLLLKKTDVALLAAVFESFRNMSLREFQLDPAHFFSTPALTWMAAQKMTKASIELLDDIDMILMIESGIRGGVSCAMSRYAKANNASCPSYDSSSDTSYLAYLDVNNLYGFALSQPLPIGEFEWVDNFNAAVELIRNNKVNDNVGYILDCDLTYPKELHDDHNDFPLAPERLAVDLTDLSEYQKSLLDILKEHGRRYVRTEKLIPNVRDKTNYILHHKNLHFYLTHGLILAKVHRVLKFRQAPIFKPYIDLCTSKRKQATSNFEKDFWKLMVNSLYGKSIENKRSHCQVKIVLDKKLAQKHVRKPLYDTFTILDEGKALIRLKHASVVMNKPIYLGFTVLELAKLHMYTLHYDIFKKHYGRNIKLIYTDTDSFIYHITTPDLFADFLRFKNLMDFSDYPHDHPLFDESNKKALGMLKDEFHGKSIYEIIALKSKLYLLNSEVGEQKRAKGTQRCVVEGDLNREMYWTCLTKNFFYETTLRRLTSKDHKIRGIEQEKLSLSAFDDKRFYLDNINSLAHGHYRINDV
ncbi:uncharacterized protein LOC127812725 [Diospyros lotus]|uniref:uncharacterized protein LOC127812725 n=1 Tax=Diospyros lotus TaxID=55363 RepID=UPI002252FC88|nr:uncharacterized protein LOC127812725 [Diospyros lotus]